MRHDDPEKLIDIAAIRDDADKFRFSAPVSGTFAEQLGYIDAKDLRRITIKVVAAECQRSAMFQLWVDETKAMHLNLISYMD